jgi:hypothetical protein
MISNFKKKRIKDNELLEFYRKRRCDVCGQKPCDPAHIKTTGSGAHDVHDNLMSLCRKHHIEQHSIGFWTMVQRYPFFGQFLGQKGWEFDGNKKLRYTKVNHGT